MTHTWGKLGPQAPAKNCCRFGGAAKPPHQTDSTRILAELRPAGTRGEEETAGSTASGCGRIAGNV